MRIDEYGCRIGRRALAAALAAALLLAGCAGSSRLREQEGFLRFRTSDGITIATELDVPQTGAGPLVLMGHQHGTDRRSWDPLVPRLVDAGYAALRVDRRSYGQSTKEVASPDDLTDAQRANIGLDLVEAIGAIEGRRGVDASRVAVIGDGAAVHAAVRCAMRYPKRVAALVLMSGAMTVDEEDWLLAHPELPVLLVAASEHWKSVRVMRIYGDRLTGPSQKYIEFTPIGGKDDADWKGTEGLREETGLADLIVWFLQEHLPPGS